MSGLNNIAGLLEGTKSKRQGLTDLTAATHVSAASATVEALSEEANTNGAIIHTFSLRSASGGGSSVARLRVGGEVLAEAYAGASSASTGHMWGGGIYVPPNTSVEISASTGLSSSYIFLEVLS